MSTKQKLGLSGAIITLIASAASLIWVVILVTAASDFLGAFGGAFDFTFYLLCGVLPGAVMIAGIVVSAIMCKKRASMGLAISAICLSVVAVILLLVLLFSITSILCAIGFLVAAGLCIATLCVKEAAPAVSENTTNIQG